MTLYVVRHGQTDYNAAFRFQGRMDIPLNETGQQQAANNGQLLKDILGQNVADYDFVSSPLTRTRQTMELIRGQIGLVVEDYRLDEQIIELSFGDWEGHTVDELQLKFPEKFKEREANKWSFVPPGDQAESYETLSHRIEPFLNSVDKPTICVTHGGVIRTMFRLIGDVEGSKAATGLIPQDRVLKIENGTIGWV